MSTYAVGDVQGCYRSLRALLAQVRFDERHDVLWLVGDLVNRGPRSAEVLRFVRDLGERAVAVLGNHDLHLLSRGLGLAEAKNKDTLGDVLDAPDVAGLLDWLRTRPLLHRDGLFVMVHAGLLPVWSEHDAESIARHLEQLLRTNDAPLLLRRDKRATTWDPATSVRDQPRSALAALTRMRLCASPTEMDLEFTGAPADAPPGLRPWFELPHRRSRDTQVVFGHWSTLGYARGPGWLSLDTGCVWKRALTAVRLGDGAAFHTPFCD